MKNWVKALGIMCLVTILGYGFVYVFIKYPPETFAVIALIGFVLITIQIKKDLDR